MRFMRNNRGAALIEFAIAALLLFTLVFGIIEFGFMMKDYLGVSEGAREGVRSAITGADVSNVSSLVQSSSALDTSRFGAIKVSWRQRASLDGAWSGWTAITSGAIPTNIYGVQVKVEAVYNHPLVTGFFGTGARALTGSMTMRRE